MKRFVLLTLFAICTLFTMHATDFGFYMETYEHLRIPYRMAEIHSEKNEPAILVVYLHGGTSKGVDNQKPLNEPATDSIANYLESQNLHALFLVPQCANNESWSGLMNVALKEIINNQIKTNTKIDSTRIYILGGSMGGTGTLNMVGQFPNFFAAAMSVAADPSYCNINGVATTPLYEVMGTADVIMNLDLVTTFINNLSTFSSDYQYDVIEGWTHEQTCIESYTTERLNWVFSHTLNNKETAIHEMQNKTLTTPIETQFWSMDGKRIIEPQPHTLYILKSIYANGEVKTQKIIR